MRNNQIYRSGFCRGGVVTGLVLTAGMALSARVMAEPVSLSVRMNNQAVASRLDAGTVVGRGRLLTHETHSGFRLWLTGEALPDAPACFRVPGRDDPHHEVRLCLGGDGWVSGRVPGEGIIRPGSDGYADFTITVAGDGQVVADDYALQLHGALLQP